MGTGGRLGVDRGFRGASQALTKRLVCPKYGVYATDGEIGGRWFPGVTNVGVKPTVGSDGVCAESYFLDFDGDLYGKTVETNFLSFLRPERKFPSIDALKEQIALDARRAKSIGWRFLDEKAARSG